MRKIDPSQAWTYRDVSRLEKRCPNGYHKDKNGVCRRIEELEGEHPDLKYRTPESYERGKRQHEAEQAEGKSPKVGEVLDSNSKVARDIRSAFTTSNDAEAKAKARKAREDLMEYLRGHDNVPPLTKAESFVMRYDAEKGEYVRAEKMEEGAFAFDGHTSTRDAYTTEDGKYTPERQRFHAQILDKIINGYTNRKGEKVPPMSKPPEGTKPRMVVLCGGSGSGKSTITPTVKEKHGWEDFQSVDPDAIMTEFFPEWDELSKQNVFQSAYLAHDEASDIAKVVTQYLINNGYNVIVDGTFSKPKKADELFGYIEASGIEYESSLIAIDVDEAVSVKSCQDRFVNTGRLVPESVAKASNRGAFDVSRNMDILSRFDTVDTFYRDGDNITEVASKETKDGDIVVRNKEHWKTKKSRTVKARATKFKVDFSGATFGAFQSDGCSVSGFSVTAERYGMDASIYGMPVGEIGYWIDDSEFRQRIIDKYAPKYPEHSDEEYYDENGMYSEELEARFHREADDWERAMDEFEASLDSVQTIIDDIKMPSVTLKCKADGYGAWDYDDSVDCKPKLHMVIDVPGRGTESSWEKCEGAFYPSQDVIDFMCAYVDEEEEMSKMRKEGESKVVKNHVGTIGVGKSKWGFDSPADMVSYGASKGIEIGYRGPFKDKGEEKYLEGVGFTPMMDPNNFLIIMDSYDGSSGVALYSSNFMGPPKYYLDAANAMIPDSEWKEYLPTIRDWIDLVAEIYSNIDPSMIKSRTKKAHRFQIYQFDRDQLRNDEDVRDVWRNALMGWDYFAGKYPDEKPWDKYSQTYEYDDDDENLEEVFYRFNEDRPSDFRGYSLSVGDIVVRDGQAYMVDTFGFTPVDFVHKSRTEKGRRDNLAQMSGILRQMRDLAHRLVSLDADYGTYNTEELLEDIDNMIYWLERERDDPEVKSKDKIDPSNPESISKHRVMKENFSNVGEAIQYAKEKSRYWYVISSYSGQTLYGTDYNTPGYEGYRGKVPDDILSMSVDEVRYDSFGPSMEIYIRKKVKKCGCGGKMEKEDESPEEPTQDAPQQTTEEDDVSDTSDEKKPVEMEDEPKEEVEKSVPMLKDPGQMFKACYEYQESRKLNGLYADEISKVCGGVDPQAVIGYHSGSGAVQRIRCSDGYIYRFNGQNMRRL